MKKILLLMTLLYSFSYSEGNPTGKYNSSKNVNEIISKMTMREKIGQLLMMDFRNWNSRPFTSMNGEVKNAISKYNLGGVILFRENVVNTNQTVKLTNDMQNASSLPLFIGIDQEGGTVTRIKNGTNFSGNMALGATRNPAQVKAVGKAIGQEVKALGANINFAPSVDVNSNPRNPVIGVRSFGSNANLVSQMGRAFVNGQTEAGIASSIKHFPGHGDTAVDSHHGVAVVNKGIGSLKNVELRPFEDGIKNGVDTIMTAHVVVPALDNGKAKSKKDGSTMGIPATLSKKILTDYLRGQMNFRGLVITDAMNMKAISDHFGSVDATIMSIKAGADIVLMPVITWRNSDLSKLENLITAIEKRATTDVNLKARIEESVRRNLNKKAQRRILNFDGTTNSSLNSKLQNAKAVVGSASHKALERTVAESAVTLVKNNKTLPLNVEANKNILVVTDNKGRFNILRDELLKNSGNRVNIINGTVSSYKTGLTGAMKANIEKADVVILGGYNLNSGKILPEKIASLAKSKGKKSILISMKNPYDLAYAPSVDANLAIYGASGFDQTNYQTSSFSTNVKAVARMIFAGGLSPKGSLPVDISKGRKVISPFGTKLTY